MTQTTTISSIKREFNLFPNIVGIKTSANLSTITTAGYFLNESDNVDLLNNGVWQWENEDLVLIYYSAAQIGFFTFDAVNNTFISLATNGGLSNTLASGNIFVGNASNIATGVAMSGDATMSNAGVLTIASSAISTAKIAANAVTFAKLDPSVLQSATVTLSAAQIKALFDTPVQLVAAPGAGKMIVIDSINWDITFVSAQYTAGGVLVAQYGNTVHGAGPAASASIAAATLNAVAASTELSQGGVALNVAKTAASNVAVYMSNATADFATGDSTASLTVRFHIVTLT